MTSRCLVSLVLLLAACDRESRDPRGTPLPENSAARVRLGDLHAGGQQPQPPDPRAQQYEGVAYQVNQGQQLYMRMNCVGCHFHGGGGMGPALMDDEWRYGGSMAQIVSTLDEGRPNGMPALRSRQRFSSPHFSFASALRSMTRRSVSTGPGLMAATRRPSFGAPRPSARVKAIKEALPAAPAM